jgi:hypothetical protein
MVLRKGLDLKHFTKHAVGNPMDIKVFPLEKWPMSNREPLD